jgi:sigma-70-like protein
MSRLTFQDILAALDEAGEAGMLGPDIARLFDVPEVLQRRLSNVNTVLGDFRRRGLARRGGPEPSPRYHHSPAVRWYITPAGHDYLAGGMRDGARDRNRHQVAARAARVRARQADDGRREQLLRAAAAAGYGPSSAQCQRLAKARELRWQDCTLDEIGALFGISRERVRQLLAGIRVGPCPHCAQLTELAT